MVTDMPCEYVDMEEAVNANVDDLSDKYKSENNGIDQIITDMREAGNCSLLVDQTETGSK